MIAANAITATGAQSDNDQDVTLISPNATSAGQTITHLSYWFGNSFVGWTALDQNRALTAGQDLVLEDGAAAILFALKA